VTTSVKDTYRPRWRLILGLLVFFSVIVFGLIDYARNYPQAKVRQREVDEELRSIPDPEASAIIDHSYSFKPAVGGSVTRLVRTDLKPNQIEDYYRQKLEEYGWSLALSEVRLSRVRMVFCQGSETAELYVPALDAPANEYSLRLGWSDDRCPNP